MSVGFGDDFKELVRANTNLVDLVSETVALTPRGGNDYVGLCPFHDDKNPSFHVYADRQSYRCWVCDEGGDCFGWTMKNMVVNFPEALELLAERANLEVPKRQRSEFAQKAANSKVTQYEIVEWGLNLMQQAFKLGDAGEIARKYAAERNLSEDTLRKFRVGYHPFDWNWLLNKAKGKFTEQQLVSVGLAGERDNGRGFYDNLVDRLVFPIIDERGRPVAFGGRVLPGGNIESDAKYWNSPESDIFLKRRTLYGFDQARQGIKSDKAAIVVEGYMDVVACHQAGATNVVATLGTALTEEHVKFLKRFTERVVLLYDGDTAGQKAAERSISRFLAEDLDLRILTLADGQDPSDYFETHDKEQFQELVKTAPEAWEYKLLSLTERFGVDSVSGRQQIMNEMITFLAAAPGLRGSMREDLILRNVCQRVQADELTTRRQLKRVRDNDKPKRFFHPEQEAVQSQPIQKSFRAFDLAERELLEIILSVPETTDYIRYQIGPDDFEDNQHRRLLELCFDLIAEEGLLPEPQRVIAAAESNSAILSLVNALLDSAREKGISDLMNEQPPDHEGGDFVPPHLERVLRPLILRRDKNQNIVSKQKMAQSQQASSSELLSDTMDALRRITSNIEKKSGNSPEDYKKHR